MAIDLKNKVVLITGASSGFGEDAARLFAREGCKVVLAALIVITTATFCSFLGPSSIAPPLRSTVK